MAKKQEKIPRTAPKLFKMPPFFKAGTLVYTGGHALTISNGYYRCALNCKGKCGAHTKQIRTETLEKSFARYVAETYPLKPEVSGPMFDKIMRANLVDILLGPEGYDDAEQTFDATIEAAKQEKRVKESDIKTAADAFSRMTQAEYPSMLFAYALGMITAATHPEQQSEMARTFSFLTKRVTLGVDGRISSVEFTKWGWYTLNLIARYDRGYLNTARQHKIKIVNGDDPLLSKSIAEAALGFGVGHVEDAMGVTMNGTYGMVKFMTKAFSLAHNISDPKAQAQASLLFLQGMRDDPALQAMVKMTSAIDLKLKKNL